MPSLEWSESLALGHGVMDETHKEFVDLLNRVGAAGEADLLEQLDAFIAHTEAHFSQEEAWMEAMQFPPLGCHRSEHEGVLEIMREVRRRIAGGELRYGPVLVQAIAEWFPLHAGSMDAILALTMRETGFDAAERADAKEKRAG
jgi:hemerythrin-like metal-binding protein